jgi:serine-type D-Ala-D-Ala carboxypeptidase/endopeptidase
MVTMRAAEYPGGNGLPAGLRRRLERTLARTGRRHAGLAVAVRAGTASAGGSRGLLGGTGAGRLPPDAIFEIGSVTKLFTATLLADMTLEGLVSLDDPVACHLPAGVRVPVRPGALREMTLADLASHTSGLPRLPPGMLRSALRRPRNPYAALTVEDLERGLGSMRLRHAPGGRPSYSNLGAGLLGHVLALRAGRSFEDLVRQRICEPLGLADTAIAPAPGARDRLAQGHARRGRPVPAWDLPAIAGAGALRSTAPDLLRLLELHLQDDGSRLARAARLTQAPRARLGRLEIGLGWHALPARGRRARLLFHSGGTGGFRSFVGLVPESGAAVVVLANSARSVDAIGFRMLVEIQLARTRGPRVTRR